MKAAFLVSPLLLALLAPSDAREVPVETRPFSVEVEAEALVVPGQPVAITVAPRTGSTWILEEVAPHGSRLKKGDPVLRVDARQLELAVRKQRLEAKRAEAALAEAVARLEGSTDDATEVDLTERLELVREENALASKRLEILEADLATMRASAPADGLLYHGEFRGGHWVGGELFAGMALPCGGATVTFIPDKDRPHLVAALAQEQIPGLEPGMMGSAELKARPGSRLPVEIASLSPQPQPDGRFLVRLDFGDAAEPWPLPGLIATIRLQAYHAPAAVVLPREAVRRDAEGTPHVAVRLADGASELRPVTLGRHNRSEVEIVDGLEPGQVVVIEDGTP